MRDENCVRCKLNETCEFVCLIPPIKRNEVMVVGEAPGKHEDETGQPFVGDSGKLLMAHLKEAGLKREDLFITNAVLCRPPGNRTPKTGEIKACRYWFQKQFTKVNPKYVLLLGAVALEQALDMKGIKKIRGKPIERDGIIYLPTLHPAAVLRDSKLAGKFQADIQFFADIVSFGGVPKETGLNWRIVNDKETLDEMMEDLYGSVSYDIETTGLYPWAKGAGINSLGFGTRTTQWLIPTNTYKHKPGFDKNTRYTWTLKTILKILNTVALRIKSGEIKLNMHNGKFDMLFTWVIYGIKLTSEFDTMLAHFMLNENDLHGLKYLAQIYFGAPDYDTDEEVKFGNKGYYRMAEYQAHDLYYTRKLKFKLKRLLEREPGVYDVFTKIMMPCSNLFTEIEYNGVYINEDKMDEAEVYLRDMKAKAEKELNEHLPKKYKGMEFNWGSTKQLGELLFEDLKLPIISKTPSGKAQVNESVVKQLDHPLVEALLRFRESKQQLSFFIDGWKPFLVDSRLHPNFKLHGTVTGRLSCDRPNLQQVPRDPRIRTLITAPPGWVLLEADLSQIELRIAAELSNDSGLVYAFLNNIDVHWYTAIGEMKRSGASPELMLKTASKFTGEKVKNYGDACDIVLKMGPEAAETIDPIWKELRKKAKAVNFGYLYGMWWKKFRQYALDNYGVKITDKQAQESRENFFRTYPDLPEWHKRQKRYAREYGFVASLSSRKRRLPAAMSPDDTPERAGAERQAINSPVQSFANELNLMALIQLRKEFPRKVLQFVGTIHDAILMEVRVDYIEEVYKRTLEVMSHPELLDDMGIKLKIPIEAEAKIGPWAAGKKLEKYLKDVS